MSDTMNLIPTDYFCGRNDALGAAAGAFIGSWFGNGWMNGGWGGPGRFGGYGYGYGDGTALQVASTERNGIADAMMAQLGNIDSNIDRLTASNLQGECAIQRAVADTGYALSNTLNNGFARLSNDVGSSAAGLTATVTNGLHGLGAEIGTAAMHTNDVLNHGFASVNAAVRDNGYETRLNVKDLQAQMASNCCGVKSTIMAEGAMTRQLIQSNYINDLQTKLCDAKARIASLENQQYTAASNAAQTAAIISALKPAA